MNPLRLSLCISVFLLAALVSSGCRSHNRSGSGAAAGTQAAGGKQFHIRGIVVASDAKTGTVTVDTEAIPGYMGAMTMPYTLAQPNIATELHPRDRITATLTATEKADTLDDIDVIAQARPDYKPAVTYNDLEPGEAVPDFSFLNQSAHLVSLAQFRGKVLLVTFIYTRCPLPNYCLRMSRNFAEIEEALRKDPKLYAKTHLLSVSFDPAHDTPKVLRSYGEAYAGKNSEETFQHWDFAAPPLKELPQVLHFFDVGATPEKDHTITHTLSTVVIGPDGKVVRWYPGNEWTPQQALAEVRKLVGQG